MSKARNHFNSLSASTNPYEGREGLVYCRVSSVKQMNEGGGLESQEGRCIKELSYLKIPYLKTFSDSYTGKGDFMNRPAMRALLEYADNNPHKKLVIVFDDLKRFARDTEFHFKLRTALRIRNIIPKCLNYNFDESPEGIFSETIFAAQGQLEREQNRRQVIQKQKARLELGLWGFASRKGYKMINDSLYGRLCVPNDEGLFMLKPALEGFANGTFITKVDVCRFLVDKGFWKKQSPEKYIDKLTEMLKDPFYAGYIEYPKWEVSRRLGKHKGLISLETFELIQKRLDKNTSVKTIRIDTSEDFPMRGLLVCADCKVGHITAAWTKGRSKRHPYYFCQNKKCESYQKSIKAEEVNKQFVEILKQNTLKKDFSVLIQKVFDKVWSQESSEFINVIRKDKINQKNLQTKLDELTTLLIDARSDILKRTYEKQIESLGEKMEVLENKITKAEQTDLNTPYQTALTKATEMLKSPYKIWESIDTKEKHRLFYFLFEEKLMYSQKEGYQTAKKSCYVRLFEEFTTQSSPDVEKGGIEPPCKRFLHLNLHT